jgi:outer membrane receptor for ferrienterochelin and colicins
VKFNITKKAASLLGLNYYNYNQTIDNAHDDFTDVTAQNRISFFNKCNFNRAHNRLFTLAVRGMYENRWGGDVRRDKKYRGGDEIFGESIYTKRGELLGRYQNKKIEFCLIPLKCLITKSLFKFDSIIIL